MSNNTRTTQVLNEVGATIHVNARLTEVMTELGTIGHATARVSQVLTEVGYVVAPPAVGFCSVQLIG